MIFNIYDANYVKGIQIKNCTEDEFLQTYKETYAKLVNKVYRQKFYKINNKCSKEIEAFIDTKIQHCNLHHPPFTDKMQLNGQYEHEKSLHCRHCQYL